MIWIILYLLIAAVCVFALCCAKEWLFRNARGCDSDMFAPVICGIFWPVCAPIYGAYFAAMYFSKVGKL